MDCRMIKNGKYLLSCSFDKTFKLLDTSNWNEITTIETGHSNEVSQIFYMFLTF